jgi:hypothetical protein
MKKLIIVILLSATSIVLADMIGNMALIESRSNAEKIAKLEKRVMELEKRIKAIEKHKEEKE